MAWTRTCPRAGRLGCRPGFEPLELRNLLSNLPPTPLPIPASSAPASPGPTPPIDAADAQTGASAVRALYHVDGNGLTAAVIDTGINYQNPALGGGFGPGQKVLDGADLADGRGDPSGGDPHGTAVAGIIASADPTHPGVAPGASIAGLRVFPDHGNPSYDTIADALQWVIDHHGQDHISVVNLSLTDGGNYVLNLFSQDDGVGQRIDGLIKQLAALDIPVVSAAGNSFDGTHQGMGFTAILPSTISVTATTPSGGLASDAQRLGRALGGVAATDLGAPGVGVFGPLGPSGFEPLDGTSFAAPEVSGAILLLQQIYQSRFGHLPSVSDVENWLQGGSDPIPDPVTGTHIGRLDLLKSASLIPQAPAPTPPPTPTPMPPPVTNPTPTPPPAPTPPPTPTPPPPPPPVATTPTPPSPSNPPTSPPPSGNPGTTTISTTSTGDPGPGNSGVTPPSDPAPPPATPAPPPSNSTTPAPTPAPDPNADSPTVGPVAPTAPVTPPDAGVHTDSVPPVGDQALNASQPPSSNPPATPTTKDPFAVISWQAWSVASGPAPTVNNAGTGSDWQLWAPGAGSAAATATGTFGVPRTASIVGFDASAFARKVADAGDATIQVSDKAATPRPSRFAHRAHRAPRWAEHAHGLRGLAIGPQRR